MEPPCPRIFGEKQTHLGATSLYSLTCEYPPGPKTTLKCYNLICSLKPNYSLTASKNYLWLVKTTCRELDSRFCKLCINAILEFFGFGLSTRKIKTGVMIQVILIEHDGKGIQSLATIANHFVFHPD